MYGVGGCGGGGGGGWHCEQNLIKRSLLSGINGVQLLLESLGILIIILILRSNPFQTLHDKGCFTQDRRGGNSQEFGWKYAPRSFKPVPYFRLNKVFPLHISDPAQTMIE